MRDFPILLTPDDNGSFLVTCPLLPEVTTYGETEAAARAHGRDAVEEAIGARIGHWEDMPTADGAAPAGPAAGLGSSVRISLLAQMKLLLFMACKNAGVTRAELARRLGWHREQVDRLFRIDHASRVDQFEAAFAALASDIRLEAGRAA